MDLRHVLEAYKNYSQRQGLKTHQHRTHLALIATKIGQLFTMMSKSNDKATDAFTEALKRHGELYLLLEKIAEDYQDSSELFITHKDDDMPDIYANALVDLFIQLMIYVGGNSFENTFIKKLEEKMIEDKDETVIQKGRFQNKRIGWKAKSSSK